VPINRNASGLLAKIKEKELYSSRTVWSKEGVMLKFLRRGKCLFMNIGAIRVAEL